MMGSQMCDHCTTERAISYCKTHLANSCAPCDGRLHSATSVDGLDHFRSLLCDICVSRIAVVKFMDDQGLSLCQTCGSNANVTSHPLLYNTLNNNNLGCSFQFDHDLHSFSLSPSSVMDLDLETIPLFSLPPKNENLSSIFGFSQQNFDNHAKFTSDPQKVQLLQPGYFDTPKESSCSNFNFDETKDIDTVWLNNFDGDESVLDSEILNKLFIDEVTEHNPETMTKILPSSSSVIDRNYNNIEDLANGNCESYSKNQIIGSRTKEEIDNKVGIFSNALAQLDINGALPWEHQKPKYCPQARQKALIRYLAKKKKRKFGKQIRYVSRKSTADTKRRFKGRFTKAGAEYDYDPRASNTKENLA